MRILLVLDGLSAGGAERQMALLASQLPAEHSIVVASLHDGPFRGVLEELGVEVHVVQRRGRFDVSPLWRIWSLARRVRPDIVHTWGWIPTVTTLLYCRTRGIPLVDGTIRGGGVPVRRFRLQKAATSWADLVVSNNAAGLVTYGIDERRGRVVHNGFDLSRLKGLPDGYREHSGPVRTVVMTGRMAPEKDWAMLFEATRRLVADEAGSPDRGDSEGPDGWRIVAVGMGPDEATVKESAADLVASGHVVFPEADLEVMPIVATADVGVLLTDAALAEEGCSNSIMEYMACALPVVCTDSGGNPELVVDGESGFLVPSGDVDSLVRALGTLRSDPDRAHAMGRAAADRIDNVFSSAKMVAGWVSVYEEAVGA